MKNKNFLFLLMLTAILVAGCSSDDDGGPTGPTISSQVFATWNLSIIIEDNQFTDDFPCEEDKEYTFNSNGTYTRRGFSTDANQNCAESSSFNGNWEAIEDNVMRLTPLSTSFSQETLDISFLNNGDQLQIVRSANLTELYNRN
jgi:hypothetical protein